MKAILIGIAVFLVSSCDFNHHDSISGNGRVATKLISHDTISRIVVNNRLDVTIIPSDTVKVVLVADDNLLDNIHCEVSNGTLRISSDKHIRMAKSKEVQIWGSSIRHIEASSLASLMVEDSLLCSDLDIRLSSGADARIIGKIDRLSVNTSSGSSLHLGGHAGYLNINASSASDIFAFDLNADECEVTASSAADVRVSIKKRAHFNASSAADIKYRGEPQVMDSHSGSLGDIRRVNF